MNDNKHIFTIGIIQQSPDLGGAETYMLSLIENFLKENTRIVLASNKGKFLERAKKFPIKTFEIPFILDVIGNYRGLIKSILLLPYAIGFYTKLLRIYKENNVDVILMSGFSEKLLVTCLAPFFDIQTVWIEYGPLGTIFKRLMHLPKMLYLLTNGFPKKIIVPSKNTMQNLISDAGVPVEKLQVIPCGTSIVKKGNTKEKLIPEWKQAFVVGNISRLTREKGQDILICAMVHVKKKIPSIRLLLVGGGLDEGYYQQLIKENQLQKCVLVTGFVKSTTEYYDCMDLFVFPTVWDLEGFGVVLIEAMMHKLPIIGSDRGPVPEIIDDNKTGILFKAGDEKALADAIITLFNDTKKRRQFAENGYKKALKNYTIELSSKKILKTLTVAAGL